LNINNLLSQAITLHKKGFLDQAKKKYSEILLKYPKNFEIINLLGVVELQEKNYDQAISLIKKAIIINPTHHALYNNLGTAFKEKGKFKESINSYKKSISIKPDYVEAYLNLGILFKILKKYDEAINALEKGSQANPKNAIIYYELGIVNFELEKYYEALKYFNKTFSLKPNYEYLLGNILHCKMKIHQWDLYDETFIKIKNDIINNYKVILPFISLNLFDDLDLQIKVSKNFNESDIKNNLYKNPPKKKIRIGYFSADFRQHAMMDLLIRLFKNHNKEKFEIIGFAFNPGIKDDTTEKISKYFNKFYYVENKSDDWIVSLSKDHKIDIAIDLMGYTKNNRRNIFKKRLAPVQINYLGYPGTTGVKYMDYIIADKVLIPKINQKYFCEKIVYLPDSYQPNGYDKGVSKNKFTRKKLGLPENSFVFCCFNNSHKILPFIFSSWMNILKKTDNSVLWLLSDNEESRKNLSLEAIKNSVNSERLIFAKRFSGEDHRARIKFADLFLDTFPYNAHVTASESLWANVPILTMQGNTFASRVASSLLTVLNLQELITTNIKDYENLAIELASNKYKMKNIKEKLLQNVLKSNLFNINIYIKNIEKAYLEIYERNQKNLPPEHIYI
jgi:predicted O-linked N-acetylglucosamine transferase (SPINDLY family)